jgi:TonB family protein
VNRDNRSLPPLIASRRAAPVRAAHLVLSLAAAAVLWALAAPPADADEPAGSEFIPPAVGVPARLERIVPVQYPEAARREGISGVVVVRARVGRDGRVRETRMEYSIPALDDFAQAMVRRYEFLPARDAIAEVESWVDVPVRFDPSLPTGARGSELVAASRYPDAERAFESDVAVLQQNDAVLPNPADAALRERIMTGSLQLEVMPPLGAEAIKAFLEGDKFARSTDEEVRAKRRLSWARAAHLAPWWPLPYLRLAGNSVAERDFVTAEICSRIVLAGRPGHEVALATQVRARHLQLAEGLNQSGRSRNRSR